MTTHFENTDKENVKKLSTSAQAVLGKVFGKGVDSLGPQIEMNKKEIKRLEAQRAELENTKPLADVTNGVQDVVAEKAGIKRAPAPPTTSAGGLDPWTSMSVKVSSSESHGSNQADSTSAGAQVSAIIPFEFGWVNIGAKTSHEETHSAASKEMANASIEISFECMRVDITRPWLRSELFYDHELRVVENEWYVL